MPLIVINGRQARITPNKLERQFDNLQLMLMAALEAQGIEVVTEDGLAKTTLGELLNDEFEQGSADRAWARSKWDGRL